MAEEGQEALPPFEDWFFNEYGGVTCGNAVDDMRAAWEQAISTVERTITNDALRRAAEVVDPPYADEGRLTEIGWALRHAANRIRALIKEPGH